MALLAGVVWLAYHPGALPNFDKRPVAETPDPVAEEKVPSASISDEAATSEGTALPAPVIADPPTPKSSELRTAVLAEGVSETFRPMAPSFLLGKGWSERHPLLDYQIGGVEVTIGTVELNKRARNHAAFESELTGRQVAVFGYVCAVKTKDWRSSTILDLKVGRRFDGETYFRALLVIDCHLDRDQREAAKKLTVGDFVIVVGQMGTPGAWGDCSMAGARIQRHVVVPSLLERK